MPSPRPSAAWPLADEATILATRPKTLAVFRFASNPHVVVLCFATLAGQGRTLDRLAALVEKADAPRSRLLDDAELARAIAASGATPATYYYGHDYRAADVARFFALAARDRVALNPDEKRLDELAREAGWRENHASGALISLAVSGDGEATLDAASRAAILRHELSHGEYFTNPGFAAYVREFWNRVLDMRERAGFRRMLAQQGYDDTNEDLMRNEMQAYLVHTPDRRFFTAADAGLSGAEAERLRARFVASMPAGWLRDADTKLLAHTTPSPAAAPAGAPKPAPRRTAGAFAVRRRERKGRRRAPYGAVSTGTAPPATLPPCARNVAMAVRSASR